MHSDRLCGRIDHKDRAGASGEPGPDFGGDPGRRLLNGADLDRKVWSTGEAQAFMTHKGEIRSLHQTAGADEEPGLGRVDLAQATFLDMLRQTPGQARCDPPTEGIRLGRRLSFRLKSRQVSRSQTATAAAVEASRTKPGRPTGAGAATTRLGARAAVAAAFAAWEQCEASRSWSQEQRERGTGNEQTGSVHGSSLKDGCRLPPLPFRIEITDGNHDVAFRSSRARQSV